ncbi:hypothetical protein [Candidatus Spongiihabitans sp.]|uniref:hypothetical protein n=1 Tax=Candidatus Spongiihabitans sp. TaxID=3101308 RepID=UPI003C7B381F
MGLFILVCLWLCKESHTSRFTITPQPVIARLVPGNPVVKPFGVVELLILNVPLASQRAFVLSIHRYLSFVIARLVPGNPVVKPFGVAELLILNVLLASQRAFVFSLYYCPFIRHSRRSCFVISAVGGCDE